MATRARIAVAIEVLGVLLAVAGACWYAVPLGLLAGGLALTLYVAPLLEVRE